VSDQTVAALYVLPDGPYSGLPGVDLWDEKRDARLYDGPYPVNQARYGHKVGEDGGCFEAALASVRTWGGVLEHPAESLAWPRFGLLRPTRGAWSSSVQSRYGEWVTEVSQRAYGHRARKRTWLLYVGDADPPRLDWSSPAPEATVSWLYNHGDSGLPRLGKREAKATPPAFRDLLLDLARRSRRHCLACSEWSHSHECQIHIVQRTVGA
jgi:hypothetical protein